MIRVCVYVWVSGSEQWVALCLSALSLTLGIFLSLHLSLMYDSLPSSLCVHFSFALLSLRLSQCISEALNEDSQHFPLAANTLSKEKSRSRKSIFFHIIKSSSTALACMIPVVQRREATVRDLTWGALHTPSTHRLI